MSNAFLRLVVLAAIAQMVAACATPQYTSSSPMVRVGSSKGYYRPGVSGKDAYDTWQQCLDDAKKQPGYLEVKKIADAVVIRSGMSDKERKRMGADNRFIGQYSDACMAKKGFKYMKYPPGEQIYVPPEPIPKAWVKPGVDYVDARAIGKQCFDLADKDPAYLEARQRAGQGLAPPPGQKNHYLLHREAGEACMRAQGFVFRELEESEWPPCWYVGEHKENCRRVPRPLP